jgi:hypothetical protein
MNNHIWELFKQSGIDIGEDQESNIEKFAELIVKECCNIMEEHSHRPAGVVKRNVKEHFGVKE